MSAALDASADKLKQFTIDKRVARELCAPIRPLLTWDDTTKPISNQISDELGRLSKHLAESQERLERVATEQAEAVEAIWNEKLKLVPGDLVLDLVCRTFGVRFKKDMDGIRLASLMTMQEIDFTIKAIIREIGAP